MVKRMHSDSEEENPSKALLLESMDNVDKNVHKNVKSFYGNKSSNIRWAFPKVKSNNRKLRNNTDDEDIDTPNDSATLTKNPQQKQQTQTIIQKVKNPDVAESDDTNNCNKEKFPSAPAVKRYYKHDIFWTSNIYGKKRKEEEKQSKDAIQTSPAVKSNYDDNGWLIPSNVSIETQTSFSSSQDSSISTKTPVMSATSSPFVEACISETSANQPSAEGEPVEETVLGDTEDEQYEMFNLDSSASSLHQNYKSDSSCNVSPAKKTPKKHQEKKTLLNYFSKLKTDQKLKCDDKSKNALGSSKKKTQRQMQFSKTGLSPKVELGDESPLYNLSTSVKKTPQNRKKTTKKKATPSKEQMYIDIGQKDFGHVKCDTCGMVYTKCQEEDEAQHAKYHQRIVRKLRFNGWKTERILEEFHDGRIVAIKDTDNAMHLKKLNEIREVVDVELGFVSSQEKDLKSHEQAFLFIHSKKVVGCVIAVPITKGFPIIPNTTNNKGDESQDEAPTQSWCCSTDPVKAICGISRVWVFSQSRRQKIATRLVDCIRQHFLYGCIIEKRNLAFSDPTPDGRVFGEHYVGKNNLLVFR